MSTPADRIPMPGDVLRVPTPVQTNQPDVGWVDFVRQFFGTGTGNREAELDARARELLSGRDILEPLPSYTFEDFLRGLSGKAIEQGRGMLSEAVSNPMSAIAPPLSVGNLQRPMKLIEEAPELVALRTRIGKIGIDHTKLESVTGGKWDLVTRKGRWEKLNKDNELSHTMQDGSQLRLIIENDNRILLKRFGATGAPTWVRYVEPDQLYEILNYVKNRGRMPLVYGGEIKFPKEKK